MGVHKGILSCTKRKQTETINPKNLTKTMEECVDQRYEQLIEEPECDRLNRCDYLDQYNMQEAQEIQGAQDEHETDHWQQSCQLIQVAEQGQVQVAEQQVDQAASEANEAVQVTSFPKIAHLSWKTTTLPDHWAPSLASWKTLHPEWQVILWTDQTLREFVQNTFPDRLKHYDSFKDNIQRVDMGRYCLLEHFGGVWCDLDIEPTRNMDNLLKLYFDLGARVLVSESAVIHREGKNLTNAFIASVPRHPFWSVVWRVLQKPYEHATWWKKIVGASRHYKIIFTSGPGVINTALSVYTGSNHKIKKDKKEKKNQSKELTDTSFVASQKTDVMPLPRAYFQFSPHWEPRPASSAGAFARILKGQSWHNIDSSIATQADRWWASRDEWAIPLMVIFFILTIVFAALFAVYYKKLKRLR